MPVYRFRCSCDNTIHEVSLSQSDYKSEMICPCGEGTMKRVYTSFASKQGRTVKQQSLGATEKRIDSGKFMKEETQSRKKDAPPGTRESDSNEFWLGNEFKEGKRKLSDF